MLTTIFWEHVLQVIIRRPAAAKPQPISYIMHMETQKEVLLPPRTGAIILPAVERTTVGTILALRGVADLVLDNLDFREWSLLNTVSIGVDRDMRVHEASVGQCLRTWNARPTGGPPLWIQIIPHNPLFVPAALVSFAYCDETCSFQLSCRVENRNGYDIRLTFRSRVELVRRVRDIGSPLLGRCRPIHSIGLLGRPPPVPLQTNNDYEAGDYFDVMDQTGLWCEARLVEHTRPGHGRFHFCCWEDRWDEILPLDSLRIQPVRTFTTAWRDALRVHSFVEYYRSSDEKWYKAVVIRREGDGTIDIELLRQTPRLRIREIPLTSEIVAREGTHCRWSPPTTNMTNMTYTGSNHLPHIFTTPWPYPMESDGDMTGDMTQTQGALVFGIRYADANKHELVLATTQK